jgi:spermidine synthase
MNPEEPKGNPRRKSERWALYASMAIISMSALILEISATRIFSIMFDYHYVFLLISLAILGLGAGGIYVHWLSGKTILNSRQNVLPISAGLMALSTATTTVLIVKIPFLHQILLAALLIFFPFFFAGVFLSAAFRLFAKDSARLYASDLIGASLGAILAILFLKFGGINANLFVAFLASLPTGLLMHRKGRTGLMRVMSPALMAGLFSIFLGNTVSGFFGEVPLGRGPYKDMGYLLNHPASLARVIDSRWSAFGRTDLMADEMNPDEMGLYVDGTAGTTMYRFDGDLKSIERYGFSSFSEYFPLSLLPAKEKEKVLIIGSGGGKEVLISLVGGATEITAVEVNRDLVNLMKKYAGFNGGLYNDFPRVKVVVEEGRSFVRRTTERYDIIMLVIPVTKTSRSLEGFALTESFLFTVESINDYLDLLNPDGRLVVGTHGDLEIFRLIFTSLAALKKRGIDSTSAMKQIYTAGLDRFPVFVLKKSPITQDEARSIHENMHKYEYRTHSSFIPYIAQEKHTISMGEGRYFEHDMLNQSLYLVATGELSPDELIKAASFEAGPVTDDDPFFYKFDLGLPPVIVFLLAFSSIALGLGWLLRPTTSKEGESPPHKILFLLTFSLLGIGFMLVEISLIQKFILFLGQPVYAMAALLFSILTGAGIGSWVSGSLWRGTSVFKIRVAAIGVSLLVGMYIISLQNLFTLSLGATFYLRILISFALLFPLGFFMGIPFPQALRLLEDTGAGHRIPRMWGINGIGSVLGSALAIAWAIGFGFSYAMALGGILYFSVFLLFTFGLRTVDS